MVYEASDNSRYSEIIKEKLGLEREPVAVKFVKTEEDIPQGIEKVAKKARHCEFVTQAAAGDIFYASAQEQACKGGSSAMGLEPRPPKVESGEFYYGLGRFDSVETSKKVVDSLPKVDEENFALLYAPLKDADFSAVVERFEHGDSAEAVRIRGLSQEKTAAERRVFGADDRTRLFLRPEIDISVRADDIFLLHVAVRGEISRSLLQIGGRERMISLRNFKPDHFLRRKDFPVGRNQRIAAHDDCLAFSEFTARNCVLSLLVPYHARPDLSIRTRTLRCCFSVSAMLNFD